VTTAKAARPHYLPASLIGGFGEPDKGKHAGHLRYAWVRMRLAGVPGTVAGIRADNVAIQNGVYDVADPGPDLPADFAEQFWKQYEAALPGAVRALADGSWTRDDWRTVLLHVQAQSIRHPDFARAVNSLRPRAWRGAECLAASRLAAGQGKLFMPPAPSVPQPGRRVASGSGSARRASRRRPG